MALLAAVAAAAGASLIAGLKNSFNKVSFSKASALRSISSTEAPSCWRTISIFIASSCFSFSRAKFRSALRYTPVEPEDEDEEDDGGVVVPGAVVVVGAVAVPVPVGFPAGVPV